MKDNTNNNIHAQYYNLPHVDSRRSWIMCKNIYSNQTSSITLLLTLNKFHRVDYDIYSSLFHESIVTKQYTFLLFLYNSNK